MTVEASREKFHHRGSGALAYCSGNASVCVLDARQVGMSGGSQEHALRSHTLALLVVLLAMMPFAAGGQTPAPDKLPRFASLRSDEVNLRVGPGENYPIEWIFKRKEMPIEILEEFQNWRRVQDWQGDKGWVLDRMITGKREVIVAGAVRTLFRQPDPSGQIVARAEPGVIARLIEFQGAWCHVEAGGFKGWVQRSEVWGVDPDETLQ
jgi:SH3-like domain-containing protein